MKAFALLLAYLACLFGLPAASLTAAASGAQITLFTAAEAEAQATHAAAPVTAAEDTEQKVICLTFDDGPTDSTTPKVLDILDAFGVRATFFLIGRQISGREDIVRRTAAAGHAVGIHTYSHVYREIYASPQALLAALKGKLPDSDYVLLSDSGNVAFQLEGDQLQILVKVPIFVGILDSDAVKTAAAAATAELYGGPITVRVAPFGEDISRKAGKLDELARLGGIRFE